MDKFKVETQCRTVGAIGVFMWKSRVVHAQDADEARQLAGTRGPGRM